VSTGQPVVPDPDAPKQPGGPVSDPKPPEQPDRDDAGPGKDADAGPSAGDDAYDEAVEESFPASDPPAASEPGPR
jgi:hypothetical protein